MNEGTKAAVFFSASLYIHSHICHMKSDDKDFTPQESLQLIRSMIESTKSSISDRSHFFLLWGYATFIGSITQYYLLAILHSKYHPLAWLITPIAIMLHVIFIFKDKKRQRVKTFINEAMGYVWFIIMCAYLVFFFVFIKIGWQFCFPFYIMLYGIGTYITGSLLKFKPLVIGGITCLLLAALTPYLKYELQILLSAFSILISYIIPGHLLRNQYQRVKNKSTV